MVQNMKRAPGRPRSFDSEAAMRNVSQAFRTGGFSATSLDEISRVTGLQRPSLYAAFGDKKDMYLAALALLHDDISATTDRLDKANLGLHDTLAELFSVSIESYLSGASGPRGCLAVCTASAEAINDADIKNALASILDLLDARIANWFQLAGFSDPISQARLISATLHSVSVRARAGQTRGILEKMASEMLELLVPGSEGNQRRH